MVDYYESNSREYFELTFPIDPSSFLDPLAACLKQGETVLDVGCGSGRDLLWLKKNGFNPTGLEKSPNLAELARKISGCPVIEADFCHYNFSQKKFDALLLIGALVHLDRNQLPGVFRSICHALAEEGYLLITMKEGEGRYKAPDGRVFNLWEQTDLEALFHKENLSIINRSRQMSKIRQSDTWLGYLLGVGKKAPFLLPVSQAM